MKLEVKRKMTKKEQKDFRWHCAFCGKIVPVEKKFIQALYLKGKKPNAYMVCEYWCPNDGIITRMEYKVKDVKESKKWLKEINVYTVTRNNSVVKFK